MAWNAGALGALMGFGQGLQQIGMMQLNAMQKKQQMEEENQLMMARQAALQRLKPPEVKTVTQDDPDQPGRKIAVTQQWDPGDPLNNKPGSWSTVGTQHVQPTYKKDTQTLPGDMEQSVLYNENDPTDVHPLGSPRHIFNPSEMELGKARLAMEGGNLSVSQQRLEFEKQKAQQDREDRLKGIGARESTVPHDFDLPDGIKVQGNLLPGGVVKPLQTPAGDFLVKAPKLSQADRDAGAVPPDTSFDAINSHFSPPSNFPGSFSFDKDQKNAVEMMRGTSPLGQLSPQPIATQQSNQQASDKASAKGPPVAQKVINGKLWYKYADGSTSPAG